jgi:hypothetical protein
VGELDTAAGTTQPTDKHRRIQAVDLGARSLGGSLEVKFELASAGGLQLGGWTGPDARRLLRRRLRRAGGGDGRGGGVEQCDDGVANSDTTPDACRTDCTAPSCGDLVTDTGDPCDDGNSVDTDTCTTRCHCPRTPAIPATPATQATPGIRWVLVKAAAAAARKVARPRTVSATGYCRRLALGLRRRRRA